MNRLELIKKLETIQSITPNAQLTISDVIDLAYQLDVIDIETAVVEAVNELDMDDYITIDYDKAVIEMHSNFVEVVDMPYEFNTGDLKDELIKLMSK